MKRDSNKIFVYLNEKKKYKMIRSKNFIEECKFENTDEKYYFCATSYNITIHDDKTRNFRIVYDASSKD